MKARTKAILATTNGHRVWNILLLKLSFHISILLRKPIHWGTPMAISIEPTTTCNLRCPQCPSGLRQFTRPTGNLSPSMNEEILEACGKNLQHINYYFQGEPFVNKHFLEFVKAARARNIYVVTSTNAHFISPGIAEKVVESGLSEIIISIDGTIQETYEKYRINGKLDKVLTGTKNLVAAKKKLNRKNPVLVFQFLVVRYNEHEIKKLYEMAKELGVDEVRLKSVQVYDFETGNDLIPTNEKYARYRKTKNGGYELKNKFKNQCWRMWSSCVFTWDGAIVPCCFDKDAKHQLGNISKIPFKETWKSSIYDDFRNQIFKDRQAIEICKNCSEGSKVWV
ncbi:radical SAM/SPASM domain-containing protein [Crocinitomix algicola]|uniref:radical SAM/SPASM domain-containing protein n=1 Tax=Crocinitomix algicola TaxID=1740263 RepID=UPI000871FC97|nr:radical SAM/SPASM domain-containing protein [Crocinitomix algicola]